MKNNEKRNNLYDISENHCVCAISGLKNVKKKKNEE